MGERKLRGACTSLVALGVLLFIGGCTKETPQKTEPKFDVEGKFLIDPNEQYIFASSTGEMSRTSGSSRPYSFSENKRVKIAFDEGSLRILEVEKDARFRANPTNDKLVLSIPIKHISYKCQTDNYNECTNTEVEDNDIPWDQKGFFKVEYAAVQTGQLDFLPINFETNFLGDSCFTEVNSRVVESKIDQTSLNFTVEKSFRVGLLCLDQLEELADSNLTARFHYSMVKASSVVSPGFVPVDYPVKDQNTFGFFSTQRTPLDSTNIATESGKISLMNHWNPNRSEIIYHLTDNFYKPENATILSLTRSSIQTVNDGLKKANVKFRIRLSDERGKNPGDIRNSMIVLVEDPVAAGLLGSGPQTEDPLTGEIISARTIMFLGTSTQMVRRTYEQLLEERASNRATTPALRSQSARAITSSFREESSKNVASLLGTINSQVQKPNFQNPSLVSQTRLDQIQSSLVNYTKNSNQFYAKEDLKSQFLYLHEVKNCNFVVPNESVLGAISPPLKEALKNYTARWENLSEVEKREVADIILPVIWVPTLIHEIGHNLGLRHNFQGSEDKENFYTDAELQALGVDHKIPSSTVMEYVEDVHALPVLGKYDIAALRFGYNREVELTDGTLSKVQATLEKTNLDSAKSFGFCTDEHTGINAGCRRFDLGTNYTEITQHLIDQYKGFYKERNLRKDRANFSLMDDASYANRIRQTFRDMRLMFEVSERIKGMGIDYTNPIWNEVEFLKDLRSATVLAGSFMIDVLTTPDLTCAISEASSPGSIIAVQNLSLFTKDKASCFDLTDELNPQYVVVGEYGTPVQSLKLATSTNSYVDQIDVRGVWADKLMAMRTLFEREVGVYNLDVQGGDNFADIPELREALQMVTLSMATNEVERPVELRFADGSTQAITLPVETYESFVIPSALSPRIAQHLRIPAQGAKLVDLMVQEIPRLMVSHPTKKESQRDFAEAYLISMTNPILNSVRLPEGYAQVQLSDEELFYASPKNILAQALMKQKETDRFNESLLRSLIVK